MSETNGQQNPASSVSTANDASPMVELGDSGLRRYGGFISEEWMRLAQGRNGILLIREMRDNHPVIGAVMFAIRNLMRQVTWNIQSASDDPIDVTNAELLESCLDDMETSWQDTLTSLLSFIDYGWAWGEIVYKVRQGPDEQDPAKRSQYTDKKVGLRKIALRSQDTLYKWDMDPKGTVLGMWQQPPELGDMLYIPRERALHLRPNAYKDNPLGRSALRNAMVPYLTQKKIAEIEAIGIERELAGYPVIRAPGSIMKPTASADEKQMVSTLKQTLKNLRRDSSEGLLLPSDVYPGTSIPLFDLALVSSGGSRQINPDPVIQRYDQRIAMVVLADFITLGNSGGTQRSGSYGMAQSKTEMFGAALGAWLDAFCEEFNRQVVPRWSRLNGIRPGKLPQLQHGDISEPALAELAAYLTSLSGAGMPLFPDKNLERHLRQVAKLPDPDPDALDTADPNAQIEPVSTDYQNQNPQPKPAGGAAAPSASPSLQNQPGSIN